MLLERTMKMPTTTVLLVPVFVVAVACLGACDVEVPIGDSGSPTASSGSAAPSRPGPSASPTSTVSGPNSRSEGGVEQAIPASYVLPQNIGPGTCYLQLPDTYDLSDAKPVDCSEPHFVEIVATFTWPPTYADTIVDEYSSQISRCEEKFEDAATAAGYTWVSRGASGSYEGEAGVVYGEDHVWFPSAAQLALGEGIGYCAVAPTRSSRLMAGSVVAGTYQGYTNL